MIELIKSASKRIAWGLGVASALAAIGLALYVFNNPALNHAQWLLQLSILLVLASIILNLVHSQLKKA
ncbi:hypothetical protein [Planococcus chinensis]|uniref:hypothetical protein n=1 Tax=Planococcus chinensis TaxID=272917 RepID=UPI001CC7C234|nr:hypothetical protein [Planococcus chinensis]